MAQGIGAITVGDQGGQAASAPMRAIPLQFLGDGEYPADGTPTFEDLVQAKLKETVTLIAVIAGDCVGYVPVYDRTNDKLKVYEAGADGGPLDEVTASTDLGGVTFNVVALCR